MPGEANLDFTAPEPLDINLDEPMAPSNVVDINTGEPWSPPAETSTAMSDVLDSNVLPETSYDSAFSQTVESAIDTGDLALVPEEGEIVPPALTGAEILESNILNPEQDEHHYYD